MQRMLTKLEDPLLVQSINSGDMYVAYYTGYTDDDPELTYKGNHQLYYDARKKSVGMSCNFTKLGYFKDVTPTGERFPQYDLVKDK